MAPNALNQMRMQLTGCHDRLPPHRLVTCLGVANWVYKWFDPHGGGDLQALGEYIAALVLHSLPDPAPRRGTGP